MFGAFARRMGASDRTIGRFLIAALGLGFALLILAGAAATWVTTLNQRQAELVHHTLQVEIAIGEAQLLVEQGETTRRGFIVTHQPIYATTYRDFARRTGPAIDRIEQLTRDNPAQQRNVGTFRRLIADLIMQRDRTIALVESGRFAEAADAFTAETSARRLRAIRDRAGAMRDEEHRLLARRDAALGESNRLFVMLAIVTGTLLMLLTLVTLATVRGYTRDLGASRDSLAALNETLEDQVVERTADLTRANEEIQRFAYIVSHDLRSPLVNVMGFTAELEAAGKPLLALVDRVAADAPQLLTEDARLAAAEDMPEAIGFIRTSTAKMDRLINAILKLSREGRRVIVPEALDPAEIADGAVAALQHRIDEHGVLVEVRRPMPRLTSDRLAVEQILSNLIENAIKYLDPVRPGHVVVGGTTERGRVVLSVEDNGRGIATSDHARVFDLFRRSGVQDQPGEGIGLAHVRALAYRLSGTIDLTSALGKGSTFRLVLPPVIQPEART